MSDELWPSHPVVPVPMFITYFNKTILVMPHRAFYGIAADQTKPQHLLEASELIDGNENGPRRRRWFVMKDIKGWKVA